MTGVRETSREAYQDVKASKQWEVILTCLATYGPCTRNEISVMCSIRINAVCGRVAELLAAGKIAEGDQRQDVHTGRNAYVLHLSGKDL